MEGIWMAKIKGYLRGYMEAHYSKRILRYIHTQKKSKLKLSNNRGNKTPIRHLSLSLEMDHI